MRRTLIALLVTLTAACAASGALSTPTPTPTSSGAASPAPSSSALPSASPSGSPIVLPAGAQIAAAGNGVVWMLVGDRLFRSTDKGATWSERTWPPSLPATIAFVSEREGWRLEVGSPATQCQVQKVAFGHTFDGGVTWQGLDGSGIADAQCKGALSFVDAQRGYVSTWSPNERPLIYRTADGGKTWKASTPLPDPAGFTTQPAGSTLRPGPVADLGTSLYVFATGQSNGQERGYIFTSSDAGATWVAQRAAPSATSVTFLTTTRWIQIGAPNESMETTDGGASWHAFATDYTQAAPIAPQIAFGDASTGYATVRGSLQRTLDGGAHWAAIKTPGT